MWSWTPFGFSDVATAACEAEGDTGALLWYGSGAVLQQCHFHRCSALGWPWRMDFSRAEATLIASSGRATSISLRVGMVDLNVILH
jgi:hypothetical protein